MEARYSRNTPALSVSECEALRGKRVFVAGCGGLGGYIIEILARAGVGALTVVDGDVFDETNLNRQLLSEEALIGVKKAEAAVLRVSRINSGVKVDACSELLTAENADRLISGCDLAVDALDNAEGRLILAGACARAGIFLVHGAIGGWFAQAAVIPPGSGIMEKLYPPRTRKPPPCGNPAFTASVCASVQTSEAVKLLCTGTSALIGKLLIIDLKTMELIKIDM